jgi:MFS superfamily sulfate permease-like transporter
VSEPAPASVGPRAGSLRLDVVAGTTAAAVVLPKAMAYATVAGLRLGFVANFISTPVLTGFKAGIGLVIVLDQLPKLLGLHVAKRASSGTC